MPKKHLDRIIENSSNDEEPDKNGNHNLTDLEQELNDID